MDSNTATLISLVSLAIAILSPLMAFWRIRIERLKLARKDSNKRQKMITDALRLHAKISSQAKVMLRVVIERRYQLLQTVGQTDDIKKHLQALDLLEKKLNKRISNTGLLYERVAALRLDGDWDEHWLRAEIDQLIISCRNGFPHDSPDKEIATFATVGLSSFINEHERIQQIMVATRTDNRAP